MVALILNYSQKCVTQYLSSGRCTAIMGNYAMTTIYHCALHSVQSHTPILKVGYPHEERYAGRPTSRPSPLQVADELPVMISANTKAS